MTEREIDWDCEVADIEGEYKKRLWGELAKRSHELGRELVLEHGIDPMCDEILTKIEAEAERVNKNGFSASIDHEMYFNFTGNYPVFIYGEENLPPDGELPDEGE